MQMTIYKSSVTGNAKNCIYPYKQIITSEEEMRDVAEFDHVCASFQSDYRSKDNYLSADCDVFDCDNSHSNDPGEWIYPEDYEFILGDVSYVVVPSRNNMKVKNGLSARPRHHVYFPHRLFTSSKECEDFKRRVYERYKFFDDSALDAARFIYGNIADNIVWNVGSKRIDEVLEESTTDLFEEFDKLTEKIGSGSRNSTMSHIAGKIIKRYGNTEEARDLFDKHSLRCEPPLGNHELNMIWSSAIKFGKKVQQQEGYIAPENYNQEFYLMPSDFSDVGQAVVLSNEYKSKIRYSPSTDYLFYNGSFWEESQPNAQGVVQELTDRQLEEAENEIKKCMNEMLKNGAFSILTAVGAKKAMTQFDETQKRIYERYEKAVVYQKYAIKRRDSKYIWSALKEARPLIQIDQKELDKNEFLLNTPSRTYDLKTGVSHEHKSDDFITKQTSVDPSTEGMDIWLDALDIFFKGDKELIEYVQKIVGLSAIGKVYIEALIIAYGEGSNGKSTFWNTIARVLGTYSGTMSADILTVGSRRNVKPELAEAKGKRLLIAAELEEGMRMNTSNVKQLCSTDEIGAEKKFKSPFSYTPSHTLVLYTNHLPRVGAIDKGTWRRLIVIPFNAKIEGSSDIKNYADYIYEKSSGAVLKWIIDGAKKIIKENFIIKTPDIVKKAVSKYQENNDWFTHFMEECCDVGESYQEKSGDLYGEYRAFCIRMGEFIRSTTDFYTTLDVEGFKRKRTKHGSVIKGLKIKSEFDN